VIVFVLDFLTPENALAHPCELDAVAVTLGVVVAQRGEPIKALTMTWLEPPKGHVVDGTTLAVYGGGFLDSARLKVRFARGEETTEVYATCHSSTMITMVTPARVGAG